jgi:Prokaryotic N-terminal methylation motif
VSNRIHGFSLIELVVATALTMSVVAAVFGLIDSAHGAFAREPEVADMQQRLRLSVDTLARDLARAGAGPYVMAPDGPLINFFPPLLPFRRATPADDVIGTVETDAVTIISVPGTAAQTTLAADLSPGVLTLHAMTEPGCPVGVNLCGFTAGIVVAVFDDTGAFDVLTIADVADTTAQVTLTSRSADSLLRTYKAGSSLAQVHIDTYFLKKDIPTQTLHLMHGDGSERPDVPVVSHVVALSFEYGGEPRPPSLTEGHTSYGPVPPPVGTKTSNYPAGENCVFRVEPDSGAHVPRLVPLAADSALVPLTTSHLADGPWCPDDTAANRWDADLLRIRSVGVTIRVEAALAALRGPAGALFANVGSSRAANRWAPDQEIRFQVSPRNVNLGR